MRGQVSSPAGKVETMNGADGNNAKACGLLLAMLALLALLGCMSAQYPEGMDSETAQAIYFEQTGQVMTFTE